MNIPNASSNIVYDIKQGILESQVIIGSNFFAMTFANKHPSLSRYKHLQKSQFDVGRKALHFLYYCLLFFISNNDITEVTNMAILIGKDITYVSTLYTIIYIFYIALF